MLWFLDDFAPCKGIKAGLDSGFHAVDSGFRIPGIVFQSLSVEFGFWISIVSGPPDSLSCIPEYKAQDFGFHKQKFEFMDSGIRIPLHGAND